MNKTKFTPGPYIVEDGYAVVSEDGEFIASVCGLDDDDPQRAANANLLAAAPDLYGACNALLGLLQLFAGRDDVPREVKQFKESHRAREAIAALAKARGETK